MPRPEDPNDRLTPEIDTIEDRMGDMRELDFRDSDEHQGRAGDERPARELEQEFPPERVERSGMTGGEALSEGIHEDGVTDDDLSPETLFDETGARDPHEPGGDGPADQDLSEVSSREIGAGIGLDEEEMAHVDPLDGEPWNDTLPPADGDNDSDVRNKR
ncbi:phosphotransferase system, HPr-related protein [Pseudomonas capeferrum]|uniref:phosphotransferase system, HPr-related protein n=1 Tax=Pseudomonas capeferrum TaxID=1495066 RepID=UPI0015E42567|nr:phosphotransferase system, HPr-related protein [Pseudomonas capeferrum]MBA1204140.1 phosphotransferase system, HPr-related protein [Pseudomonas capeferrum]